MCKNLLYQDAWKKEKVCLGKHAMVHVQWMTLDPSLGSSKSDSKQCTSFEYCERKFKIKNALIYKAKHFMLTI